MYLNISSLKITSSKKAHKIGLIKSYFFLQNNSMTKTNLLFFPVAALVITFFLLTGCSKEPSSTNISSNFQVTLKTSNLLVNASALLAQTGNNFSINSADCDPHPETGENSCWLQPSEFSIAVADFHLISDEDEDESEYVSILNPDEDDPTYTLESPKTISFTSDEDIAELINVDNIAAGTYTGFTMKIVYMDLTLPAYFHIEDCDEENGLSEVLPDTNCADLNNTEEAENYKFRMVFNNHLNDILQKRDLVVELESGSDEFFWINRNTDTDKLFYSVSEASEHIVGDIIDLFTDDEFWGESDDVVVISSLDETANTSLEGEIEVSETESTNLQINVDLQYVMNFQDSSEVNAFLHESELDLGKDCQNSESEKCDLGLRPSLPTFTATEKEYEEDLEQEAEEETEE